MFRLVFTLVLISIFITKICETINLERNTFMDLKHREPLKYLKLKRSLLNSLNLLKRHKRDTVYPSEEDVKNYEDIQESTAKEKPKSRSVEKIDSKKNPNSDKPELLDVVKQLLSNLTKQINLVENDYKNKKRTSDIYLNQNRGANAVKKVRKRQRKVKRQHKWGMWTAWSACSVTCGRGREIRWRHCLENCDDVETEMDEKACQLPACGPAKLFGFL